MSRLGVFKNRTAHEFRIVCRAHDHLHLLILDRGQQHVVVMQFAQDHFFASVEGLSDYFHYAYIPQGIDPPIYLIDPYARAVTSHYPFGQAPDSTSKPMNIFFVSPPFDWGQTPFELDPKRLKIYEMPIRGFTRHHYPDDPLAGTFKGAISKIDYLKNLNINIIELMPLQFFNECAVDFVNPIDQGKLLNSWGYAPLNFFTLMQSFCSSESVLEGHDEIKSLIKACHEAGIGVILDVVFNHTGELLRPQLYRSFEVLAKKDYYILEGACHTNFSGCGNTFNCNSDIGCKIIIDCLRYLIEEFHFDGFRFDLASVLMRDTTGTPLPMTPVIQAIQNDPVLQKTLLISEPWDAAGLYHVGSFPLPFFEWNGWYRDVARQFIHWSNVYIRDIVDAFSGSPNLYKRYKCPYHSINFIACHDGFTLLDSVSYLQKRNLSNGEGNRDGSDHNISTNCGVEGESFDPAVIMRRKQKVMLSLTYLFCSIGTPMIAMGDECGHTKNGNNNTWCHDNYLNYLNWDKQDPIILEACQKLLQLRDSIPFFSQADYQFLSDLHPLDAFGNPPDLHSYGNFIAFTFYDAHLKASFYIAFNTSSSHFTIKLPHPSTPNGWRLLWNTESFLKKEPFVDLALSINEQITPYTAMIAVLK